MNRRSFMTLASGLLVAAPVEPTRAYSFIWAPPTLHENWQAACRMAFGESVQAGLIDHDAFREIFAAKVGHLSVAVDSSFLEGHSVQDIAKQLRQSFDDERARQMARIFPA